jgi:hypothetical protein
MNQQVHLVGSLLRKYIEMHGPENAKNEKSYMQFKKIPTNALYYNTKLFFTNQSTRTTCFDPLWVILREGTSIFV